MGWSAQGCERHARVAQKRTQNQQTLVVKVVSERQNEVSTSRSNLLQPKGFPTQSSKVDGTLHHCVSHDTTCRSRGSNRARFCCS